MYAYEYGYRCVCICVFMYMYMRMCIYVCVCECFISMYLCKSMLKVKGTTNNESILSYLCTYGNNVTSTYLNKARGIFTQQRNKS